MTQREYDESPLRTGSGRKIEWEEWRRDCQRRQKEDRKARPASKHISMRPSMEGVCCSANCLRCGWFKPEAERRLRERFSEEQIAVLRATGICVSEANAPGKTDARCV